MPTVEVHTQHESQWRMPAAAKEIFAGTCAGLASKPLSFPLDTVKVRLQNDSAGHYRGTWHCLRLSLKESGLRGLYAGVGAPIMGASFESAVAFLLYCRASAWLREHFHVPKGRDLELWQVAMAGGVSGLGTATVLGPVERVKCILQHQEQILHGHPEGRAYFAKRGLPVYKGTVDCLARMFREHGAAGAMRSLYMGGVAMYAREIPGNAAWYGSYMAACKLFTPPGGTKDDLPWYKIALAGGMGGCAYWAILFPADTLGNRLRATGKGTLHSHFRDVLREKGPRGLYAGFPITVVRAIVSNAVIFSTFEVVHDAIKTW
eukprot:TRINITY_DN1459_c0_g1_i1.p1 TRINITY_DN1459_c0_g1~~TRINITY_DN1459_c0_g1_i1.p1  ORF type:complete len:319 (+),score=47.30 TRINITY_DN1459_c0_g1_i1:187-1143(+)